MKRALRALTLAALSACGDPVRPEETPAAVPALAFGGVDALSSDRPWGPWSQPVNLSAVNSSYTDNQPTLSRDQLSLYFASPRPGGLGGNDIWVSRRVSVDSPWEDPLNLGAPINTSANDQGPTLSPDGLLLLFHSNRAGGHGGQDIYVARRTHVRDDFDWGAPVNLGGDVNTSAAEAGPMLLQPVEEARVNFYFFRGLPATDGDIFSAAITRNGKTLGTAIPVSELNFAATGVVDARATVRADGKEVVFFSTRPGGFGLEDLYVSTRQNIGAWWSTPANLGPSINTGFTDTQPSLYLGGDVLLFSSDRPGGLGDNDIWMSTRDRAPGYE
jgi:hypothetical protein